jgi:hypothetical protein
MGERELGLRHHSAVIVQKIKIKCARRVRSGTQPPEVSFQSMQKHQKFNGLEIGFDRRHGVDKGRSGGIGPGGGFVEGGYFANFNALAFQLTQRALQRVGRLPRPGRKIAT